MVITGQPCIVTDRYFRAEGVNEEVDQLRFVWGMYGCYGAIVEQTRVSTDDLHTSSSVKIKKLKIEKRMATFEQKTDIGLLQPTLKRKRM